MTTAYLSPTHPAKSTHVLLVAVGAYPHLLGGTGPLTSNPLGLHQLSSPPISARAVADWFIARQLNTALSVGFYNPSAQLASVEMLVSPEGKYVSPGGPTVNVDLASMGNIREAVSVWLERLKADQGSTGVFYFCGHGIMAGDQYLLAEDFGKSNFQPWTHSFDITNTIRSLQREVSGPLYFFIDSCLAVPRDVLLLSGALASPLIATRIDRRVTSKSCVVINATKEGELAFALNNEVSFFTRALIRSLSGFAGRKVPGQNLWAVTADELRKSIFLLNEENKVAALRQQPTFFMSGDEAVLHYETQPTRESIELNIEIWTERRDRLAEAHSLPRQTATQPSPAKVTGPDGAKVFINCADTDSPIGRNLFRDLSRSGHHPWMPAESLIPGQNRRHAIDNAIRTCNLFITLSSQRSLRERGYFRVELRKALDLLEEMPRDSVFIVPARVDDCEPDDEALRELFPVVLFPDYADGVAKILKALDDCVVTD